MTWIDFGWQGWLTLATLAGVLLLLVTERVSADMACLGGLALLLATGVVDVGPALAGFSNEGVLTVAALYVVAAGLYQSGALGLITGRLFSPVKGLRRGLMRLMAPTAISSGFLNNTPIVAILIPGTIEWAKKNDIDPARVLIPLSYAAILGGTCTLIGTSTNLVIDGLLQESGYPGFSFFAIAWVGVPVALVGMLFLVIAGPKLLPRRNEDPEVFRAPARFTIEVSVPADSPHIDKPIGDISLGDLVGLAPVAIARNGVFLNAPGPTTRLMADDHLIFSEPAAAVLKLHRFPGFSPAPGGTLIDEAIEEPGRIVEVVLSQQCPLVGSVVGDGSFRSAYGAAVLAVSRHGHRLSPNKEDGWKLRAGDVCLLEARDDFDPDQFGRDVFVIGEHGEVEEKPLDFRSMVAVFLAIAMVGSVFLEFLTILQASAAAAALMVALKILSPTDARDSLDWTVLLTIASAFGIAAAMEQTGVAGVAAKSMTALGAGPWMTLLFFYLVTSLLTESITNNAAAALLFPFALTIASSLSVSPIPFAVAIMFAASASFATPLGYQTNLMVYGAGNYQFRDFLRVGVPMNVIVAITAVALIPIFFPF